MAALSRIVATNADTGEQIVLPTTAEEFEFLAKSLATGEPCAAWEVEHVLTLAGKTFSELMERTKVISEQIKQAENN